MVSGGSMFSLSKLRHYGSLKNLGLYSVFVRFEGHGPESEVILLSVFLGVNTPGSFLGQDFLSLVGFFHGLNFSLCFSVSSINVWLPVLVLTFTTRSTTSSGRSHVKKPFLKLHLEFRDLAMFSKTYIKHNIIASCLINFTQTILIIIVTNTKISRFQDQAKPCLALFKHNIK